MRDPREPITAHDVELRGPISISRERAIDLAKRSVARSLAAVLGSGEKERKPKKTERKNPCRKPPAKYFAGGHFLFMRTILISIRKSQYNIRRTLP